MKHLLTPVMILWSVLPTSLSAQEDSTKSLTTNQQSKVTEVIMLPTIHRNHLKSKTYSVKHLEDIIRKIKPDVICTEITVESLAAHDAGKNDRRLSAFPEYTKVILPLREDLKYKILPCSAWSRKVNFQTVGVEVMTKSHSEKIAEALDGYKGKGQKVLVTFGGGHLDGLIKHLSERKDITITDYRAQLKK